MVEEKIAGDDLQELMDKFVYDIILQKRKWLGMEMPPLHRLFPHNVRELFELWYNLPNQEKVKITVDINEFHQLFMKKMAASRIKCKLVTFKSDFNRAYGSHKYKFNNLRLTRLGLHLYLKILPDIKNGKPDIKAQRN